MGKQHELPQTDSSKSRAWTIGIAYGVLIGWDLPINFQATIFLTLITAGLFIGMQDRAIDTPHARKLLIAGIVNALGFTLISNQLVQALHWLVGYSIIIYLWTGLRQNTTAYSHGLTFGKEMCLLPFRLLSNFFYSTLWRDTCSFRFGSRKAEFTFPQLLAIATSAGVAIFFAAVLSTVNEKFYRFINLIIYNIQEFFLWLLRLGIIESSCSAILVAVAAHFLLNDSLGKKPREGKTLFQFSHYQIIIIPLLVVLFCFCCFQIEFLTLDVSHLSFKELSKYTQNGFYQLLWLSALGAVIWYLADMAMSRESTIFRFARVLFCIFALELLALTVFSHHKLLLLQEIFGLKDQRIVATAGALLLTGTFFGFIAILFKKLEHSRLFELQLGSLIVITLLFSYCNLESSLTKTYPIRFVHEGTVHNDHSYLLTNSFDNASSWLTIMDEVERTGVVMPGGYYWGAYKPLCVKRSYLVYRPHPFTHLKLLRRRYSSQHSFNPRSLFRFNLREWSAYQLLIDEQDRFKQFQSFLEQECNNLS